MNGKYDTKNIYKSIYIIFKIYTKHTGFCELGTR